MKKIHFSPMTCAVVASLLVGCNEGESNSPDPVVPPTEMKAMAVDGFSVVMPEENTQIDLNRYLRVPDARVTNVIYQGENPDCGDPTVVDGGFQVRLGTGALCDYRYTAQYNQVSSDASFRVLASADESPFLPSLSKSLVVDTDPLSVNLQTELGANWPPGYALDTVTLVGDLNKGSVTKGADNTLTYKLRSTAGWDTIEYTLKNTSDEKNVKTGSIFVTVSDEANQAPTITSPKYDYSANNPDVMVTVDDSIDINLASLTIGITDADGDPWQLVHVQSFSATVAAKNPDSTTNKVITFMAHNIGEHIVSYIVSDNYGGYASGLVKVNVDVESVPRAWSDITSGAGSLFSAPPTYVEATKLGFAVSAVKDTKVNNTVALFKDNAALSYCATSGYIPTELEFGELWASRWKMDGTGELNTWPQGGPGQSGLYLVRANDRTAYKQFDIKTGQAVAYGNQPVYLTCIMNTVFRLEPVTSIVVANGESVNVAIAHKPTADSFLVSPSKVSGTLAEADVDVSFGAREERKEEVDVKSTTAGTYQFRLNVQGTAETAGSHVIRFIAEVETAQATIPDDLRIMPNGVTVTQVPVSVSDEHGNAISNVVIRLISDDPSDVITPNEVTTGPLGEATFTVVARTLGSRTYQVVRDADSMSIGLNDASAIPRRYKGASEGAMYTWTFEAYDTVTLWPTVVVPENVRLEQFRVVADAAKEPRQWTVVYMDQLRDIPLKWFYIAEPFRDQDERERLLRECGDASQYGNLVTWSVEDDGSGVMYCGSGNVSATDIPRTCSQHEESMGRLCVENPGLDLVVGRTYKVDESTARVVADTELLSFLNECGGVARSEFGISFSITEGCSQLEFSGSPWNSTLPFSVRGQLQNNLGMELGTLP